MSALSTRLGTRVGILLLAMVLVAWLPIRGNDGAPGADHGAMACPLNVSARNTGNTDIWIMFYDTQIRRTLGNTSVWGPWYQLKSQNHRVAPGATIKRSWTDTGGCNISRQFRWKLKKGTNFHTHTQDLSSKQVDEHSFTIGDVARFF